MSTQQVRYLFTSGDEAQIEVRGFLIRDGIVSVNAPPSTNAVFNGRASQEQILPVKAGHEYTETQLIAYAKDNGFTLTKAAIGDTISTSLNEAAANGPADLDVKTDGAGLENELTWTGSAKMEIWRSVHGDANFAKIATMGSADVAYDDAAIVDGLTYYYKVRVIDTVVGKVGSFSNVVSIVAVDNS